METVDELLATEVRARWIRTGRIAKGNEGLLRREDYFTRVLLLLEMVPKDWRTREWTRRELGVPRGQEVTEEELAAARQRAVEKMELDLRVLELTLQTIRDKHANEGRRG